MTCENSGYENELLFVRFLVAFLYQQLCIQIHQNLCILVTLLQYLSKENFDFNISTKICKLQQLLIIYIRLLSMVLTKRISWDMNYNNKVMHIFFQKFNVGGKVQVVFKENVNQPKLRKLLRRSHFIRIFSMKFTRRVFQVLHVNISSLRQGDLTDRFCRSVGLS